MAWLGAQTDCSKPIERRPDNLEEGELQSWQVLLDVVN
ncbi:hypothetical protein E5P1_00324 (plasmid) [Variovorax sp. PBL-E5]|nr:hypothetical protein SRS16P1_00326 [Variovorax sp. SRS16]VTU42692.1 hypothetical protein E5P1_00324 [Variovorax sp. PBL-E5]